MYLLVIFLLMCSCNSSSDSILRDVKIRARDDGTHKSLYSRDLIYHTKIPRDWISRDPLLTESIFDTTKALHEFFIVEGNENIRITIHNFPTDHENERIPPQAQVFRWKRQFETLEPSTLSTEPQSFGGFVGLRLIASGLMHQKPTMMIAWSMQLAPQHRQMLHHKQMLADYTIKAIGPKDLMEKYQTKIISFARTFELIEDIPDATF
jgi:hypothetical protein